VKKLTDNLRIGRRIYTNIDGIDAPECLEMIKSVCNLSDAELTDRLHILDREQTQSFWLHVQDGSLIILDEVHKFFSNRNWASQTNVDFCEWASTHRHNGFDVVLITQDIEKIDKHARSLIEWTYFFRKINFFGKAIQKKYLCYAYAGDDHNGQPQAKNIRAYDVKIFRCYKSYVASDIKELGFMSHVNLLKHPIFYAIPVVLSVTLYMFFSQSSFASGDVFGTKSVTDKAMARLHSNNSSEKKVSSVPAIPETAVEQKDSVVSPSDKSFDRSTMRSINPIRKYQLRDGSIMLSNLTVIPPGASLIMD
jgi:zona occludens toxin (predicted ATPase)